MVYVFLNNNYVRMLQIKQADLDLVLFILLRVEFFHTCNFSITIQYYGDNLIMKTEGLVIQANALISRLFLYSFTQKIQHSSKRFRGSPQNNIEQIGIRRAVCVWFIFSPHSFYY